MADEKKRTRRVYYAHSTDDPGCGNWQPLKEHHEGVADLAKMFAAPFGAERASRLAGLLHDLGKYSPLFQARLNGAKERVDHSTAGAAIVGGLAEARDDKVMAELVSYAIAGHHAGLPDKQGADFSCLADRLKNFSDETLDPVWTEEIAPDAVGLVPDFMKTTKAQNRFAFSLSFLGRMIFSCLVDADYKDTESFYARTKKRIVDREWPLLQSILPELTEAFERRMCELRSMGDDKTVSPVRAIREDILSHVRAHATDAPGLFTLTVPTGGGKTLASLAFALDHARIHGTLRRIIYAAPFTSIIDQTAKVFREALGEQPGHEFVLEHHSSIEEIKSTDRYPRDADSGKAVKDKLKLAMEDWAAPIVVTTNVQLFESLFSARTSRCRKLHNIAGSIIILDEAQTLPLSLLAPATWALRELTEHYGCTIVLCTATQPALDEQHFNDNNQFKAFPMGLPLKGRELAPDPVELSRKLSRVRLQRAGAMDDKALVEALSQENQGLVIVNSRRHALALYQSAKEAGLDGLVHLTTRQYAAHRRTILADIRERLHRQEACRVIATSLVEAGVDVDFPKVWRAEAGLDQIVQAAGRCNREGRRPLAESVVTVFSSPDYVAPPAIKDLSTAMNRVADRHDDLLSLEAIEAFFREAYWLKGSALDEKEIWKCFRTSSPVSGLETIFAYRTAAEKFQMIETGMVPIIIAVDDKVRDLLAKLTIEAIPSGAIARELQSYIVQTPPRARDALIKSGHVYFAAESIRGDQFAVLGYDKLYNPEIGLMWDNSSYIALEDMII